MWQKFTMFKYLTGSPAQCTFRNSPITQFICDYGFHGTRNFSFLAFFQFLVSRREIGDEKREIDFLHFLPNFGQILVLFEDFSKHNQHFRGF